MYVIYVDYGKKGTLFCTGPASARFRQGLWAHWYRRVHPVTCSCLRCLERVHLGPVSSIPHGLQPCRMYPV